MSAPEETKTLPEEIGHAIGALSGLAFGLAFRDEDSDEIREAARIALASLDTLQFRLWSVADRAL